MLRKLLVLSAPIALLLLLEALFAAGVWEPLAQPESHAGTSVRLKRALGDPALPRLDYVTLGSSRPEYGLDHALLAASAQEAGLVHADLSMPGAHWTTIGIVARWLERHRPEVRGGIIALSVQDLQYTNNGSYELGILQPFRRVDDTPWIAERIPVKRNDLESYAVWSALFGWRDDIREFVRAPRRRLARLEWYATQRPPHGMLFGGPTSTENMCAFGLDSLDACDRIDASGDARRDSLARQCSELRSLAANRLDFRTGMADGSLPVVMLRSRALVRAQLRDMKWSTPPVVVLMPMPPIWQRDVLGRGQHQWARAVLQPLVEEGSIQLVDATDFFSRDTDGSCSAFFDFYHQNAAGRDRLTRWLLPQLKQMLYQAQ
ncbi:MAG: hypothetical protein EOP90_09950 [Lysobacteraceae bacterium]|nr:MAG: hypothetical protein EOP90_09950 [Xanthomonadaceae bacterium]